jgi:hypothetical protein
MLMLIFILGYSLTCIWPMWAVHLSFFCSCLPQIVLYHGVWTSSAPLKTNALTQQVSLVQSLLQSTSTGAGPCRVQGVVEAAEGEQDPLASQEPPLVATVSCLITGPYQLPILDHVHMHCCAACRGWWRQQRERRTHCQQRSRWCGEAASGAHAAAARMLPPPHARGGRRRQHWTTRRRQQQVGCRFD